MEKDHAIAKAYDWSIKTERSKLHTNRSLLDFKTLVTYFKIWRKISSDTFEAHNTGELTVFALGIRNSPGSSTSAVDVVKLLRKRHLSSNKNELKNKASNVVIVK